MSELKFLPYPYERLRRVSRRDAAFESWCARWLAATRPSGNALRALLATVGPVAIAFDGVLGERGADPEDAGTTMIFGHARDTAVTPPAVRAPEDETAGRVAASRPRVSPMPSTSTSTSTSADPQVPAANPVVSSSPSANPNPAGANVGAHVGAHVGANVGANVVAHVGANVVASPGPSPLAAPSMPRGPAESTFAASPQGQRKAAPPAPQVGRKVSPSTPPADVDPRGATFADPQLLALTVASASGAPMIDQDAAYAELRVAGVRVPVVGGGLVVRAIAQRLLGGPAELAAPRRLVPAEHAIFALVLATLLEDLGARGEVVPRTADEAAGSIDVAGSRAVGVRLALGAARLGITAFVPRALALRAPPLRRAPAWAREVAFDLAVVIGRCALPREAIAALAPRDIVTIDGARDRVALVLPDGGELALALDGGGLVVAATAPRSAFVPPPLAVAGAADAKPPPNATARVATEYRVRDMALPDDAHAELTVTLGSTRLSLAAITELAAGQVLSLSRPLAGPFDLVVAGKRVGTGELVDVEGELGVRVLTVG